MNNWQKSLLIVSLLILFSLYVPTARAKEVEQDPPVVFAILFYSTTCGHCHLVITETLPPLIEKYGNQLQIMGINVSSVEGQEVYQAFLQSWNIPDNQRGVPTLVVGDTYLVGSGDIPAQFPGIVENGINEGGIKWPDIPGLLEIINQVEQPTQGSTNGSNNAELTNPTSPPVNEEDHQTGENTMTQSSEIDISNPGNEDSTSLIMPVQEDMSLADRFKRDLAGNILAVVALAAMVISVIWILIYLLTPATSKATDWSWLIPILSVVGFVVAGYLSFVEVTQSEAVCGPIGDCNTVQQSPYAILFGFLPVGILGLLGYIAILGAWLLRRLGPENWYDFLTLSIWGMALFGVLFSIYLTYLEPFVIGATCAWCVSSAIIITLQLWAATEPVRQLWRESEESLLSDDQHNIRQKTSG